MEKFLKNGAKVFIGGTYPIQVENWINVTQMGFWAFQVVNQLKTWLASCLL